MTLVETGAGKILCAFRDQMYLITFSVYSDSL